MANPRPLAAVPCPVCPSDSAYPQFMRDASGVLTAVVFTCMVCSHSWMESYAPGEA